MSAHWVARAALVLVVAACVGLAAFVLSSRQETEYEASTRLLFDDTRPELQVLGAGFGDDPTDTAVRMANEAAAMESFTLARRVARDAPELGLEAGEVDDAVVATPVRGTEIVELTATASAPDRAQALAEAYRDAYVRDRRQEERRRARAAYEALDDRLDDLPPEEQVGAAGATLRQQLGALDVLREVGSGTPEVVSPAREPTSATAPQTGRNVLFGLLFGLLLGVGLVALRGELGRRSPAAPARRRRARSAEADRDDLGADADVEPARPVAPLERSR